MNVYLPPNGMGKYKVVLYQPHFFPDPLPVSENFKGYSYKSVESILKTGLDRKNLLLEPRQELMKSIVHLNIRGKEYYQ
jgi:hypothetical protein